MKRKYYLLVLFFIMSVSSCNKFLEPLPTDFVNPTNYYQTTAQMEFARASVYSMLGSSALWGAYSLYLYGWQDDEGYMNRSGLTAGPFNYFYSSSDSYNSALWSTLFNAINRANQVLANVDRNPAIDQAYRDKIRGEMLFLRGYFYFTLVQYYGGVPLKLEPTTDIINVDIPRASVKDTYAQIVKDMEAAEALVPGIAVTKCGGVINKSAVRGLLARVNLFMAGEPLKDVSRYVEASKWAKMVIDDTEAAHALNPSYYTIFKNLIGDKYDIKESIWEVEFWGNRTDQYVETGLQGWINGPQSSNTLTGRADAYMNITSKLYNIYEPGDNRKWYNIACWTYYAYSVVGSKTIAALPLDENAKNQMKPAKFRREFEVPVRNTTTTPENVPILRYTDILMMYAEAENEIKGGPTAAAIDAVNQVRRRGWSTGIKTITITNGGTGYTTAPTIAFAGGGGTGGAAATSTITGGKVTAITLTRDAAGIKFGMEGDYLTPPTITITGGAGTGATATATINLVTDGNLTPAQTASKESFRAFIQDERMREFCFENSRKADLLRWGIFLKVNQDMGNQLQQDSPNQFFVKYYSNVSVRDLLSPIPVNETTTNLGMVQNPGWN